MFKEEYLLELLSGKLTSRGYANILGTITSMVRKYQWKKSIIVSDHNDNDWQSDDIKELSHQFFEWIISKNKIKYLSKVPFEYLSYYFTQMFISFVSNRIKEEQQKVGLSFQKCQELVQEICQEDYDEEKRMVISIVFCDFALWNSDHRNLGLVFPKFLFFWAE